MGASVYVCGFDELPNSLKKNFKGFEGSDEDLFLVVDEGEGQIRVYTDFLLEDKFDDGLSWVVSELEALAAREDDIRTAAELFVSNLMDSPGYSEIVSLLREWDLKADLDNLLEVLQIPEYDNH
jgi:hypothetical protein